jgi:hypothetical protein
MLLAVAFDDRVAFDKLWQYYKNHRNGSVMDWRTSVCGGVLEAGSATDGELDTAMALIQAGCKWGGSYRSDATTLIGAIRSTEVTTCNGLTVLRAGANFGGCDRTNPSYFSPAYYKVFATLDTAGAATWTALANDSYTLLATLQGKMDGLVPDWTDSSGNLVDGDYGPDASRTPWRIATDYVWNNEAKAVTFLGNVASYVEAHGGVARTLDPNSTYRGPLALSGLPQGATTAKTYADAWLTTAVDDQTYFPGTLRSSTSCSPRSSSPTAASAAGGAAPRGRTRASELRDEVPGFVRYPGAALVGGDGVWSPTKTQARVG